MAIVHPLPTTEGDRRTLALDSPVDRRRIGELEVDTTAEVQSAVARARAAQPAWAARSIAERAEILRAAVGVIVARRAEIAETIRTETGKPEAEALGVEIVPACDFLNYWTGRARRDLRSHRQRLHGYLKPLKKLYMQYQPLGVIGVVTPWNAPFVLSLNPVVQALVAGNTVVFKPSEVTPRSGEWVARVLHEAGVPEDVVQVLHGDGETGAALVDSDIDKVCFTGSVGTGRKIAAACATRLLPCTLELGGKDAMIVCADADLERAAAGAVYLSMFNTGQVCMSVERIYVVDSVADEFIRLVTEKAAAVTYGPGDTDMGPLFWDRQRDIVIRHIDDAKAKGADIVVGGAADTGDGLYFQPTVVVGVHHDMDLMTEETFGPVTAIMRVRDEDEAIRLANDCKYGLSGSVFTKDAAKARRIAAQLTTGSVVHNDAAVIYGVPEAPFGGRKDSGVGQVNGPGALRGFTHAQPVLIDRWQPKGESIWYPYSEKTIRNLDGLIRYGFGNKIMRKLLS
ncbi:aldehyde dehydrogenase family protein [Nocardia africana]|uniref:Aldehyde dehydrogenase n=1 Tax=Nocardia africana TaxID=134964 RepID=A0A378WXY9_9NOCA|nr:aldehyde dehydrogenase family protein [Nocardia africana]MCC3312570.1 aldehyde dehydrogenase family protein [Nocardia africana]SUA46108.1 Putative succinate-semialdehyde dehydrogenase [NADP(+)] 2 [Nocardia africana]